MANLLATVRERTCPVEKGRTSPMQLFFQFNAIYQNAGIQGCFSFINLILHDLGQRIMHHAYCECQCFISKNVFKLKSKISLWGCKTTNYPSKIKLGRVCSYFFGKKLGLWLFYMMLGQRITIGWWFPNKSGKTNVPLMRTSPALPYILYSITTVELNSRWPRWWIMSG